MNYSPIISQAQPKSVKRGPGHGNRGGQPKPSCANDIPPEFSLDTKQQYQALFSLQRHLFCNEHLKGLKHTYCYIKQALQRLQGGHCKVDHSGMTLWAKHIVSTFNYFDTYKILIDVKSLGLATVHHPPNMLKNDFLVLRRHQSVCKAPKVHVTVNIAPGSTPTPPCVIEASIIMSTLPIIMQAIPSPLLFPEKVNNMTNTPPPPYLASP